MADCLAINFRVDASPTFSENTPAVFSFQASESAFNQTSLMIFFFGIIFHLFPSVKSLFDVFSRFYDCLDFQFEAFFMQRFGIVSRVAEEFFRRRNLFQKIINVLDVAPRLDPCLQSDELPRWQIEKCGKFRVSFHRIFRINPFHKIKAWICSAESR